VTAPKQTPTIHVEIDEKALSGYIRKALDERRKGPEPEPIAIPGVPTSISRESICGLIKTLGLDPNELVSMRFDLMGIHVEVYALNAEGRRFTADGENIAMHRMTIAIDDSPSKPDSDD
jgi:hypothetical protein